MISTKNRQVNLWSSKSLILSDSHVCLISLSRLWAQRAYLCDRIQAVKRLGCHGAQPQQRALFMVLCFRIFRVEYIIVYNRVYIYIFFARAYRCIARRCGLHRIHAAGSTRHRGKGWVKPWPILVGIIFFHSRTWFKGTAGIPPILGNKSGSKSMSWWQERYRQARLGSWRHTPSHWQWHLWHALSKAGSRDGEPPMSYI